MRGFGRLRPQNRVGVATFSQDYKTREPQGGRGEQ